MQKMQQDYNSKFAELQARFSEEQAQSANTVARLAAQMTANEGSNDAGESSLAETFEQAAAETSAARNVQRAAAEAECHVQQARDRLIMDEQFATEAVIRNQ